MELMPCAHSIEGGNGGDELNQTSSWGDNQEKGMGSETDPGLWLARPGQGLLRRSYIEIALGPSTSEAAR